MFLSLCGVQGQGWYLIQIVSIPDLCLLTYFYDRFHGYVNYKEVADGVHVCVRACEPLFMSGRFQWDPNHIKLIIT